LLWPADELLPLDHLAFYNQNWVFIIYAAMRFAVKQLQKLSKIIDSQTQTYQNHESAPIVEFRNRDRNTQLYLDRW